MPEGVSAEGMCGLLLKSLYGTRDASGNWEAEYSDACDKANFKRGLGCPCVFVHDLGDVRMMVHGDDFIGVSDIDGCEFVIKILTRVEILF